MSQHSTPTVPFEKYHGTGNDFVIVDADAPVPDREAFAQAYCDRDSGVTLEHADEADRDGHAGRTGADGVLFLAIRDDSSDLPRVEMTLVQPDGSIAAMCGNGARCAAAWAARRLDADELVVDTDAGARHATIHEDGSITIEMGAPAFGAAAVPLARESELVEESVEGLTVTAVNTGVPHAVAFVDDVDAVDLETVAPPVRHASVFPEGANVNLAAADGAGFAQRTFERGVEGETRSCGTGAVAIAAAAKHTGRLDGEGSVRVSPPGGDLEITIPDDGPATLAGPVEREFVGELPVSPDTQF